MEITYDTGAKVILQGPVTYEVESLAGGYLSVGKLTARVEKSEIRNPKSETISKSANLQISKFVVRTPTATVTDLGTEFGVEVSKEGHTTSHVFRGSVRLVVDAGDGKTQEVAQVLHENQSARVENRGNQGGGNRIVMLGPSVKSANFVRQISKQSVKIFDLVDVVAGGDGFSGRRNRGIDPTSGRAVDSPPKGYLFGDGHYHRVQAMPPVDGVFIPDGRTGPVQLDSAGHTFAAFPPTDNATSCYIWAGGAIPAGRPAVTGTQRAAALVAPSWPASSLLPSVTACWPCTPIRASPSTWRQSGGESRLEAVAFLCRRGQYGNGDRGRPPGVCRICRSLGHSRWRGAP